ncbi:MAG: hypothetical protein R8M45_05370 [Ghiorsea sp.]
MSTSSFVDLQPRMLLEKVHLNSNWAFPDMMLERGDKLQVTLSEDHQLHLLEQWFTKHQPEITQNNQSQQTFGHAVGMVLNGKGLVANITIEENIMLPFLYHNHAQEIDQAHLQLERVATTLGLHEKLGERAGLRSPLTHGLVSLCRCLLQQASFVVMQQPCASMSVKEAEYFRPLAKRVIESLDSGMIYLTTSADDTGSFTFSSSLNLTPREVDE